VQASHGERDDAPEPRRQHFTRIVLEYFTVPISFTTNFIERRSVFLPTRTGRKPAR